MRVIGYIVETITVWLPRNERGGDELSDKIACDGFNRDLRIERRSGGRGNFLQGSFEAFVAGVISGYGPQPFAKLSVKVFEVRCSRLRRFDRVFALIQPRVNRQTVLTSCTKGELPQSRSFRLRDRKRGEAALDKA